jgi:hypothetical protein
MSLPRSLSSLIAPSPSSSLRLFFSYHELVRQNYLKGFRSSSASSSKAGPSSPLIDFQNIEEHLTDGEFTVRFNLTKEEFRSLPKWKQTERKKNLMLF